MSKKDEALKLALEALEESLGYVEEEAENAQRLYGQYPTRQARIQGLKDDARKHRDAITAIREALAEQQSGIKQVIELYDSPEKPAQQEPVNKYCCHLCFNKSGQMFLDRMILCPKCGNKRCPKATHHELPCTNSNEPGQPDSIYTSSPANKPWVGLTEEDRLDIWKKSSSIDGAINATASKLREKNA